MKTCCQQNQAEALSALIATKNEVDEMLHRLQKLSDAHLNTYPDEVSWGDAGRLQHRAARLCEITENVFLEGENAR